MSEIKLLVIDDEVTLNDMLKNYLETRGYQVLSAVTGEDGLRMAYENHPDLIVLDIMMPKMDGFETCQRLREASDVPILILSARLSDEDIIRGFEAGADDYVKKPFVLKELALRINAILKRAGSQEKDENPDFYEDQTLKVDFERQLVFRNRQVLHMTPTEFKLLSCLVQKKGQVITHKQLLIEVWGETYLDAISSLSIYIRYLREKIEDDPGNPKYIRTQWGTGYWFAPPEEH